MNKRKLKTGIAIGVYIFLIIGSFLCISLINNALLDNVTDYDYSKSILKEVTQSVLKEEKQNEFSLPYNNANVEKYIGYYDVNDTEENKSKSLIYYEKTYMPSTGIFYTSNENFDVLAIYDGIVLDIKEDDILGTYIEVKHNDNLVSYYYSLTDVKVSINDEITSGTVLGKASANKLSDKYSLFHEVYYQGKSINPENIKNTEISELD